MRSENFAKQPKPKPDVPVIMNPGSGEDTARFGLMPDVVRLALQTDVTHLVTLSFVGTSRPPSKAGTSFEYHDHRHHGQDQGKLDQLAILNSADIFGWGKSYTYFYSSA